MAAHERLERLLGGAALRPLRQRLRARYERGLDGGVVTLGRLTALERAALSGILGRRGGQGAAMRIDIGDLDAALRHAALAESLRDALQLLDGPIVDRGAQQADTRAQWEGVRAACGEPRLASLLADPRGLGLLKRVAGADPLLGGLVCEAAQRVLARLPAPAQARSHLAADVLGDAHGLDPGRPVATLVLAVLRRRAADEAELALESEETVREIWAAAGVLVNELARPVLFLNLPGAPSTSGEPAYLSLRALLRAPPSWRVAGLPVYVCENPNLLAIAADVLAGRCAPLVCTDGMPAAAQRTLLGQLRAAGASLRYHGDFDWPGITIGNLVMRQFGAAPWRFFAADYEAAVVGGGRPLGSAVVAAEWDAGLAGAMRYVGWAIDEEAVAEALLRDLS
ncbi:TIGR02679 family protein [Massilia glaciei]|uniref:TIGR02679 family protein n=1 Tax=Massilia glaciei TaxID=1524097 RepID=A0A2U2HNQ7_9BURK|nr:TIGR02679 family protein [Massilia glaciei]PWF49141.1 TIGR02679 family protein [Massilia glaciei]